MPAPGGQRDIEVKPCPSTRSTILKRTAVAGIIAVLVKGDGQNIITIIENRLSSIAVMHIPVNHGKFRGQPFGPRGLNRDGDIGKEAEPIGKIGQAVMPRRTRQRIGILQIPLKHGKQG